MKKINILILMSIALSGCASLQSVSMTQVPKNRSTPIKERVSNWGFLGIHFTNDFVDEAVDKVKEKCPGGRVTGVYTKYESFFYLLLDRRVVDVSAYCESKT